jgi:hypothetical protein
MSLWTNNNGQSKKRHKFVTQNKQLPVTAFKQAINRLYNNYEYNKMDKVRTRFIVARSRNHCCEGNSTVPSLSIVAGLRLAVKT